MSEMSDLKLKLIDIADESLKQFIQSNGREPSKSNSEFEKNLVIWSFAKKYPPNWLRNYYKFKKDKSPCTSNR